jgi:PKD repeat protein
MQMMTIVKRLFPALILLLAIATGCKKDSYNFKNLLPTVKSFYTITSTGFDMGNEIQFKNESLNAETYAWDFGDGTKSTEANPKKVFTDAGDYNVSLKAVGAGGTGNYFSKVTIIDPNAPAPGKETLFFMEYGASLIKKIPLAPGSVVTQVANIAGKNGLGVAYDAVNDKLFYGSDQGGANGAIIRMDIDGTNVTTLVSGAQEPYSVALNPTAKKIYWTRYGEGVSMSNYDGTNVSTNVITVADAELTGIAYSAKTNRIYFYDFNSEDMYVANADGTNVQKLIPGIFGYAIFVDDVNGKIYYDDRGKRAIMKANLDGTNIEQVVNLASTLRVAGIGIDYTAKKIYWSDRTNNVIRRANLDGTGAENFLTGLSSPRSFFIR